MNKVELIKLFTDCCNNSVYDNYRECYLKKAWVQNVFQFDIENLGKVKIQGQFAKRIIFFPSNPAVTFKDFDLSELEFKNLKQLFNNPII